MLAGSSTTTLLLPRRTLATDSCLECVDGADGDEGEDHRPVVGSSSSSSARPPPTSSSGCLRLALGWLARLRLALGSTSRHSARLLIYLGLNLLFMGLEALVGFLTNSLTLTTDAMHMLLDCAALAVGLVGEVARQRQLAQRRRPLRAGDGLVRFDAYCALVNAVLLLVVAVSVAHEALSRMSGAEPPLIDDPRLLPVAVAGLSVNLVGLACFHDHRHVGALANGERDGCDGCGACGPFAAAFGGREGKGKGGGGSENMRGVFLHVLADTMGSVGAIASSLLARQLGWRWPDPICSLLVAGLIVAVALPLLRDTLAAMRWAPDERGGAPSRRDDYPDV